jgi:hypothetical protein
MKKAILIFTALVSLGTFSALADEVTCESKNNSRQECAMDIRGQVWIIRQISDAPCIEGKTWGRGIRSVWVSQGCRAVFASDGGGLGQGRSSGTFGNLSKISSAQVTCESLDNEQKICSMGSRGRARIIRQLSDSACIENRTWGYFSKSIWVSEGCRGVFVVEPGNSNQSSSSQRYVDIPNSATCESFNNRRQECPMDTGGRVWIIRQVSDSPCIEGRTWGKGRNSVWVSEGCRAVFASDGEHTSRGSRQPSEAVIRSCRAESNRSARVVDSTEIQPGFWAVILNQRDGDYVCIVSDRGTVSSIEKLRR